MISAKMVSELREKTGCGMMDCKKALTDADGDMEKAVEILREKGLAAAAKKAGRIAAEGIVDCYVTEDGKAGVIAEVNSETDFVAKNTDFQAFCRAVSVTIAKNNPADLEALLGTNLDGTSMTVQEVLTEKILTIGENMNIRRFYRAEGAVVTYIHGGGRIGVLVEFDGADSLTGNDKFIEAGKDVCMQIAAMNPQYLSNETVPAEVIEKEKEILQAQILNDEKLKNKPAQVIEKMVEGRIGKFYENYCLLNQAFVKDGELNVGQYVTNKGKELGAGISVKAFIRYEKGEGLQKKEDNFADEVASMIK